MTKAVVKKKPEKSPGLNIIVRCTQCPVAGRYCEFALYPVNHVQCTAQNATIFRISVSVVAWCPVKLRIHLYFQCSVSVDEL